MSPLDLALFGASTALALAMGGSGLAPAFGATLGAGRISRVAAVALFTAGVLVGALALGDRVARTLGSSIVRPEVLHGGPVLAVLCAAAVALYAAHLLKIPQSTSWVVVFALVAVGAPHGAVSWDVLLTRVFPAWLGLPVAALVLTVLALRPMYPLSARNRGFVEGLLKHQWKLRAFSVTSSFFVAVSIGANNVANVVGPLAATGAVGVEVGLLGFALVFGLGAALLPSATRTVSAGIVPLGLFTASLCNVVVGLVLCVASAMGVPQSLVQVSVACVLGVALVKEGPHGFVQRGIVRKLGFTWLATPCLAAVLTVVLSRVLP